MLELYRFVNMNDIEDVKLEDISKTDVYDEGYWLTPKGDEADLWKMNVDESSGTVATQDATRLAKMVWMERGRTDSKAIGKMTVIRGGGVRGKTDVFIVDDAASMKPGVELTLKVDTDGVVKMGVAAAGDIVKALVYRAPSGADGLLHFELVS